MIDLENVKKIADEKIKLLTKKGKIIKENIQEAKRKKKDKFIKDVLEDLEKNHNHSWYDEIYERNKNNLDDIALFYRGTEITYREMFQHMEEYARSLKSMGVNKETEIPICSVSNSPEFIYLMGGASIVGAKINVFAHDFRKDYITEIIKNCNSNIMFVEDNYFDEVKDYIPKDQIKNVIVTSLATSLTDEYDKYKKYDNVHSGLFEDKSQKIANENDNVITIKEFEKKGENYKGNTHENVNMDEIFSITYSSGTTSDTPKAIVHPVRSFITIGRCHDPEIQKTTSMKNFTVQSGAPTFSNTDLIASISDALMQGSKLALEPIFDGYGDFLLNSLLINEPTYVIATRSQWIRLFKKIETNPEFKDVKLPKLLIPFAVGEGIEPGEEKYINNGFRKLKAGTGVIPLPVSPITISLAGGDCEHGGIFWQLYRSLQSKRPGYIKRKEKAGMKAFEMVEYEVLNENGEYCKPYEYGRLVANSPCNMKEYKNNKEATEKFFIKDAYGKLWGDCSVYAYLDYRKNIHMKGRIPKNKEEIPPFVITEAISKDTKRILSCETININGIYVAHIELQPNCKGDKFEILKSIEERCKAILGKEKTKTIVYRFHSYKEGFKTTHSGKRDLRLLEEEGLSKAIKPVSNELEGFYSYIDAEKYLEKAEKQKMYRRDNI